jgi:hypothetical protein
MIQMTGEEHAALVRRAEHGDKLKAALESVLQETGSEAHALIEAATKRADKYRAAIEGIVAECKSNKLNAFKQDAILALADAALLETR